VSGSTATTLNPGTYCNGITISGSSKIFLGNGDGPFENLP